MILSKVSNKFNQRFCETYTLCSILYFPCSITFPCRGSAKPSSVAGRRSGHAYGRILSHLRLDRVYGMENASLGFPCCLCKIHTFFFRQWYFTAASRFSGMLGFDQGGLAVIIDELVSPIFDILPTSTYAASVSLGIPSISMRLCAPLASTKSVQSAVK